MDKTIKAFICIIILAFIGIIIELITKPQFRFW